MNDAWAQRGDDIEDADYQAELRLAHAERCLTACEGLPDGAIAGGWTAAGMSAYAKKLEDEIIELKVTAKNALPDIDSPLQKLGGRLVDLLDGEQFDNLEQYLMAAHREIDLLKIALRIKTEEHDCCADDLRVLATGTNALLHQIDIGDFVDSNGHSAQMLKPVHDLMKLLSKADQGEAIAQPVQPAPEFDIEAAMTRLCENADYRNCQLIDIRAELETALAQPEQGPVVGTKTWFDGEKIVTQNLTASDVYAQPVQPAILTDIDAMAKVYSSSYASPHHITFTAEGLRSMMEAAIAQIVQPAKKEQS